MTKEQQALGCETSGQLVLAANERMHVIEPSIVILLLDCEQCLIVMVALGLR